MFSYKQCIALGALLMLSLDVSMVNGECKDCLGDQLVELANTFETKEHCWFNTKHHYMLKFKLDLLMTVTQQLKKLLEVANGKVESECQTVVPQSLCSQLSQDAQANCDIDYIKTAVQNYRNVEACHGQALNMPQLVLGVHYMQAVMDGWKQIHTTC